MQPGKFQFIPVQKIELLGFTLDSTSMTVSLIDIKQQKVKTLIDETLHTAQKNEEIFNGKLLFLCSVKAKILKSGK